MCNWHPGLSDRVTFESPALQDFKLTFVLIAPKDGSCKIQNLVAINFEKELILIKVTNPLK